MNQPSTLYRVIFKNYSGQPFHLQTFDEAKIGPWLAEMFGVFPYLVHSPTVVEVIAVPWSGGA